MHNHTKKNPNWLEQIFEVTAEIRVRASLGGEGYLKQTSKKKSGTC